MDDGIITPFDQATTTPRSSSDFEYVFNADGTCGARFDCAGQGVVLAYDTFSPETAMWFCAECWDDEQIQIIFEIVEDRRPEVAEEEIQS